MNISQSPKSDVDPYAVDIDMSDVQAELAMDTEDFIKAMLS